MHIYGKLMQNTSVDHSLLLKPVYPLCESGDHQFSVQTFLIKIELDKIQDSTNVMSMTKFTLYQMQQLQYYF